MAAAAPIISAEVSAPGLSREPVEHESGTLPKQQAIAPHNPLAIPVQLMISEVAPSARPARLLFGALKAPTLRLRKPIPLDLSIEETEVVLTWAEIDEFGYGSTMGEAAEDFSRSLAELYCRLQESELLGPDLLKVKQILSQYIETRAR